ncbi:MAG TPA: hypothetical protein VK145_01100 [Candidatus Nanoarchaeia archaeon]|nr:hypothetical protein [Candidatus Nanoarchaeia archaeon]
MSAITETESAEVTLKKGVRTFKKLGVQKPHHQYATLYRTGKHLEKGQVVRLGPVEQVVYDHRIKPAQEVLDEPGTFVLIEEIAYELRDVAFDLLSRVIHTIPKPASKEDLTLIADAERLLGISGS